jgi:SAM-dependent methyltransferase
VHEEELTHTIGQIVRDGYRSIGNAYETLKPPQNDWRDMVAAKLAPAARILELGCGTADDARALAQRGFVVTGVDLVARAPNVAVVERDLLDVDFADRSFDACISFYVLNHVPREHLAGLLAKMRRWLVPGGWILHSFGTTDEAAWTGEWLGATMFFSSFPPSVNAQLVRDAGFEIERDEVAGDGDEAFQWILAHA